MAHAPLKLGLLFTLIALLAGACRPSSKPSEGAEAVENAEKKSFDDAALRELLTRYDFGAYGGEVRTQRVDLDGKAPEELLVEVDCGATRCQGDFHHISGARFLIYDVSSPVHPRLLNQRPILAGLSPSTQMIDFDGDGQKELMISSQTLDGQRRLQVYSRLEQLLAERFVSSLPYGALGQLLLDLDGDGTFEMLTFQQAMAGSTAPDYYNVAMPRVGEITVQTWGVTQGRLDLKAVQGHDGLARAFEAQQREGELSSEDLAKYLIAFRFYEERPENLDALQAQLMRDYASTHQGHDPQEELSALALLAQRANQNGYYPGAYQGLTPAIDPVTLLLLQGLAWHDSPEVSAWSKAQLTHATSPSQVTMLSSLAVFSAPNAERERTAHALLKESFSQLATMTEHSEELYTLGYFDPNTYNFTPNHRAYYPAAAVLSDTTIANLEPIIKEFLNTLARKPVVMNSLLSMPQMSGNLGPHLLALDTAQITPELSQLLFNQILPNYVNLSQQRGGLNPEEKARVLKLLQEYISRTEQLQPEVLYFIASYFQDPALSPQVAPLFSEYRKKFASGRATQQERDALYSLGMLFPVVMNSLPKSDYDWWINYIYKQNMGYSLDAALSATCYEIQNKSEAQIEAVFKAMETFPKESTLAELCLPSLLGTMNPEQDVPPLSEKFQKRLLPILMKSLDPKRDEYQLQQALAASANYADPSLKSAYEKIASKRTSLADSARFEAMLLLYQKGDTARAADIEKTLRALYLDPKTRTKYPFVNYYYFPDAVARYADVPLIDLLITLAQTEGIAADPCYSLQSTINGYLVVDKLTPEQKAKIERGLCLNTEPVLFGEDPPLPEEMITH